MSTNVMNPAREEQVTGMIRNALPKALRKPDTLALIRSKIQEGTSIKSQMRIIRNEVEQIQGQGQLPL
jgi:hypothetical protein